MPAHNTRPVGYNIVKGLASVKIILPSWKSCSDRVYLEGGLDKIEALVYNHEPSTSDGDDERFREAVIAAIEWCLNNRHEVISMHGKVNHE